MPQPSNFFVRNNAIRDNPVSAPVSGEGGSGAICVWANTVRGGDSGRFPLSKSEPVTERLFSGFRIEGNTIINPGAYGILLRNTKNAVIRHNRIINPGAAQTDSPVAGIGLDQVSDTIVADNEVVRGKGSAPEAVSLLGGCDPETVRIENNRIASPEPREVKVRVNREAKTVKAEKLRTSGRHFQPLETLSATASNDWN